MQVRLGYIMASVYGTCMCWEIGTVWYISDYGVIPRHPPCTAPRQSVSVNEASDTYMCLSLYVPRVYAINMVAAGVRATATVSLYMYPGYTLSTWWQREYEPQPQSLSICTPGIRYQHGGSGSTSHSHSLSLYVPRVYAINMVAAWVRATATVSLYMYPGYTLSTWWQREYEPQPQSLSICTPGIRYQHGGSVSTSHSHSLSLYVPRVYAINMVAVGVRATATVSLYMYPGYTLSTWWQREYEPQPQSLSICTPGIRYQHGGSVSTSHSHSLSLYVPRVYAINMVAAWVRATATVSLYMYPGYTLSTWWQREYEPQPQSLSICTPGIRYQHGGSGSTSHSSSLYMYPGYTLSTWCQREYELQLLSLYVPRV